MPAPQRVDVVLAQRLLVAHLQARFLERAHDPARVRLLNLPTPRSGPYLALRPGANRLDGVQLGSDMQADDELMMSRQRQAINLAGVIVPFAGLIAGLIAAWGAHVFDWRDLLILSVLYMLPMLGVTVGFHRLLTHRSFETFRAVRYIFAMLGSLAVQGPVIKWVADHRKHHAFSDQEGDPHSPHVGRTRGLFGALRGLWHAHVGWLFTSVGLADAGRYARELIEDPLMRVINRSFGVLTLFTLALPFGLGWLLTGKLSGALWALVWGGLVRIFLVHHITWSVNSLCHFAGQRRFETTDRSSNLAVLAIPTLGEAWHNNHHAFPRSAFHGLRWWEVDVSGLVIRAMESVGLAWNVVRIDRTRQSAKALTGAGAA
jgi:stearoyl-CoA desaturase (delta-9 desaturase)